jgi:hypothetical protein
MQSEEQIKTAVKREFESKKLENIPRGIRPTKKSF